MRAKESNPAFGYRLMIIPNSINRRFSRIFCAWFRISVQPIVMSYSLSCARVMQFFSGETLMMGSAIYLALLQAETPL